jgi:uncharacterized protein YyaL (SSP411 family)
MELDPPGPVFSEAGHMTNQKNMRGMMKETGETRIDPLREDSIISARSGFMTSSMTSVSIVFIEQKYIDSVKHAAAFVRRNMRGGRKLKRYFRKSESKYSDFTDDHALMASGVHRSVPWYW